MCVCVCVFRCIVCIGPGAGWFASRALEKSCRTSRQKLIDLRPVTGSGRRWRCLKKKEERKRQIADAVLCFFFVSCNRPRLKDRHGTPGTHHERALDSRTTGTGPCHLFDTFFLQPVGRRRSVRCVPSLASATK